MFYFQRFEKVSSSCLSTSQKRAQGASVPNIERNPWAYGRMVWFGVGMLCLGFSLWIGSGCGVSVCRSDQDCAAPAPRCILAQCRACAEDTDCAQGQFCERAQGQCKAVSGEMSTDSSQEPNPPTERIPDGGPSEPAVTPDNPDQTPPSDNGSEPVSPDLPIPEGQECVAGQTRPCYSGDPSLQGVGECKAGVQICSADGKWGTCQGEVLPTAEICDGLDNDCDGKIDQSWPDLGTSCLAGQGLCQRTGQYQCQQDGKGVVCDARPGTPVDELCDEKDNNCDGQVDETFGDKGKACFAGVGDCRAPGKLVCRSDGKGLECDAKPSAPSTEKCDGRDNDCDGQVDENTGCVCTSGTSRDCGIDAGECKKGTQTCTNGQWGSCTGNVAAIPEVCDGKDNDCDGQIDNGLSGASCTTNLPAPCQSGTRSCTNGQLVCTPNSSGMTEQCRNNRDEDCDGKVDEICGALHAYAIVRSAGTIASTRGNLQSQRLGDGRYRITSPNHNCNTTPIFATVAEKKQAFISYRCATVSGRSVYEISIYERSLTTIRALNANFHVVIPQNNAGEIFGVMDEDLCYQKQPAANCRLTALHGTATIREPSEGVFEITAAPCAANPNQPIFVLPDNPASTNTPQRAIGTEVKNQKCYIYIHEPNNVLDTHRFAFWLPDITANAFAHISQTGQVVASNNFNDQNALWTAQRNGFTPVSYDVRFNAWINPSATLLNSARSAPTLLSFDPQTNGVSIVGYANSGGFPFPILSSNSEFYVLFVQ